SIFHRYVLYSGELGRSCRNRWSDPDPCYSINDILSVIYNVTRMDCPATIASRLGAHQRQHVLRAGVAPADAVNNAHRVFPVMRLVVVAYREHEIVRAP